LQTDTVQLPAASVDRSWPQTKVSRRIGNVTELPDRVGEGIRTLIEPVSPLPGGHDGLLLGGSLDEGGGSLLEGGGSLLGGSLDGGGSLDEGGGGGSLLDGGGGGGGGGGGSLLDGSLDDDSLGSLLDDSLPELDGGSLDDGSLLEDDSLLEGTGQ
jgi:hypothetical protein